MTNHDESERASQSYAVAFKVGTVGSIFLTCYALLGNTLAGLVALSLWSFFILLGLPRLYVWYCDKVPRFSDWAIRGPHQ